MRNLLLALLIAAMWPGSMTAAKEIVLPVTEAKEVAVESQAVMLQPAGVPATRGGTLHWRVPETVTAGPYYVCFRLIEKAPWNTHIFAAARHDARVFSVTPLTDPQPIGEDYWQADLCAEQPRQVTAGDVISINVHGVGEVLLRALVLRTGPPPIGPLRILVSTWGRHYQTPDASMAVDTALASGPDENRSGTARITVLNFTGKPRRVNVRWQLKDFYGLELDRGSSAVEVESLDIWQRTVDYKVPPQSQQVLFTVWADAGTQPLIHRTLDILADRLEGPRPRLLLSGQWDFAEADPVFLGSPPGADQFKPSARVVPDYLPFDNRGRGDQHVGWYRKRFALPGWLTGRRLALRFDAVSYECDVYVNGQKVGHHFGPKDAFEFDVTEHIKPGANEIVVGVRDWIAGADPEGLRRLVGDDVWKQATARREFEISRLWNGAGLRAPSWDAPGGILDDVILEGRAAVQVADVFVQPSVREKSLTVDVAAANRSGQRARVTPVCTVYDQGRQRLRFAGEPMVLEAGVEPTARLRAAFADAPLWWPHDPHLLHAAVWLEGGPARAQAGGQDVADVRFGFREVWFDGQRLLFNGRNAKMVRSNYQLYEINRALIRNRIGAVLPFGVPPFGVPMVQVCLRGSLRPLERVRLFRAIHER